MKYPECQSCIGNQISQFLEYSKTYLAPSSYEHRYSQLVRFDSFLAENGYTGGDINEQTVNAWIQTLTPFSDSTIMTYVVSVRKFLEYLNVMGVAHCYIPPIKTVADSYVAHYFSDEELDSIYSFADDYPCGGRNPLPYIKAELPMVLRILESCGTRLTETLSLQMKHVDIKHGILTIVHAKKDKERIVPMSESLRSILERYCMAMGIIQNPEAFIFPKLDFSSHLEKHDIGNRFSYILKWSKLGSNSRKKFSRGICPHCFRHCFALKSFKQLEAQGIHLNDAVPYLSIYLGHDSLMETEKYLRFSAEMYPDELCMFDKASSPAFPDDGIWSDLYAEEVML